MLVRRPACAHLRACVYCGARAACRVRALLTRRKLGLLPQHQAYETSWNLTKDDVIASGMLTKSSGKVNFKGFDERYCT